MRTAFQVFGALAILQILAALVTWTHLWRRYRRPGVPWYRYWGRDAFAERHELFVPAAKPILRHYARLGWIFGATVCAAILDYLAS